MIRIRVLASGSEANCLFVGTEKTRILIDAGLTASQITERLALIGEDAANIDAVLVTHEHGDHTAGLPRMIRKYHMPLYLLDGTRTAVEERFRRYAPQYEMIQPDVIFSVGEIECAAFSVHHDCDCVGFALKVQGIHIGVATDLAAIEGTEGARIFPYCDVVLLESNYDPDALGVCAYAQAQRTRIMDTHMSNEQASGFVRERLTDRTSTLILGHISRNSNDTRLVRAMARESLAGRATRLEIVGPDEQSKVFTY